MRPLHIGGDELQPGDAFLGTEYVNVVLDEFRDRNEVSLRQIAFDAKRTTNVLTMDQHVHQAGDRATSERGFSIGSGAPKGLKNCRRVLLTPCSPVSCHPPVVVQAVAKHPGDDRPNSEGALRTCGYMRQHVPYAPQATKRGRVPLLVVQLGEAISEI